MKINYNKYKKPFIEFIEKFDWTCEGCLTPPFKMSNLAAYNAIQRMFKLIGKKYPEFRMFCVAERFSKGGYHIHYLIKLPSLTANETIKFTEMKWADSIGVKKPTNNKSRKYDKSKGPVAYYLKSIMQKNVLYEFGGNY
jgi:hypothetical protein